MRLALLATAMAALLGACPQTVEVPPPDGVALVGGGAKVRALLDAAVAVEGSQLALRARAVREQLAGCANIGGVGASFAELIDALACIEDEPAWAAAARAHAPGDGVLLSLGDADGRLIANVTATAASIKAHARFRERPTRGPATLFLPARESAGPMVLSPTGALVHARFRVEGGVDIGAMAPKDSQAAELFGLQADLLSSAVMSGTWEVAMYAPDDKPRVLPPIALAFGVRSKVAAERALAAFLDELRQKWPVQPTETSVAGRAATCLPNVRILPDLSPCAIVLDDAVVLGWNPDALAFAVAAAEATGQPLDGVRVALDAIPAADERLARARSARPSSVRVPWSALTVAPLHDEHGAGFLVSLTARGVP